jgi:hypothetical protein
VSLQRGRISANSIQKRASVRFGSDDSGTPTFQNDHGLMALIEELRNGKVTNEIQTGARISGTEHQLSVEHQAWEIETLIRQTAELREGLIGLAKDLQKPGAGLDRGDITEKLATLHHQLSDLRAHVDIAKREVVLAKRVGLSEKGMGLNGSGYRPVDGLMRGVPQVRGAEPRGLDR